MVLAQHYEVTLVGNVDELQAMPANRRLDVAILCHSLSSREIDLAVSIVRQQWPHAKILPLSLGRTSGRKSTGLTVRGLDGPSILLQAIDHLLSISPPLVGPHLNE
jgi:hypothetical protein